MPNMQLNKNKMPELDPNYRNKCFEEVACGLTEEMAISEAERCLNCKTRPCVAGCPVGVKIPEFIALCAKGDFEGAYQKIKETNSLPAVCGRVCPQESQCESKCVRGIKGEPVGIGMLERYCADRHMALHKEEALAPDNNKNIKVAILGSGPAGLTCAGELAKDGYKVTIFEAFHKAGGVLTYGIPEFRLPKDIVLSEVEALEKLGVEIKTDMVIGRVLTVDELFDDGFKAVFIATGAGLPTFLNIEGEGLVGVFSANEYLTRINLMKAYLDDYDTPVRHSNSVAVIGGGNVAMDAARCAKRLGAEHVYIVYRRSEEEMPARAEEIHHAKEEGIEFKFLSSPNKINSIDGKNVSSITCDIMELGEADKSGRPRPVLTGRTEEIEVDTVIMALGTSPNPLIRSTTPGLDTNNRGCIVTEEDGVTTSREGVFAGGDAVTGAATVILAMGAGKAAAEKIKQYLSQKID